MRAEELDATIYGGRWWRERDGVIETYDPDEQQWVTWDGSLFGGHPPPSLFGEDDEAPQPSGSPSVNLLKFVAIAFVVLSMVQFVLGVYLTLEQAEYFGMGVNTEGDLDAFESLQTARTIVYNAWEISVGAMIAITSYVAYRYIEARRRALAD